MRPSVLLGALLTAVYLNQPDAQQGSPDDKGLIEYLNAHERLGNCRLLDDFVDQNIHNVNTAGGDWARSFALNSLVQAKASPAERGARCVYHDRKASLRVALDVYWASAGLDGTWMHSIGAEAWLGSALGRSWREKLADAGLIVAVQDLVAIHLSCFRKDGQSTTPFWEWFIGEPNWTSRYILFDAELTSRARSVPCQEMVGQANFELACYWNAMEIRLAATTDDTAASVDIRSLRYSTLELPRAKPLMKSLDNFADQIVGGYRDEARMRAFLHPRWRRLVAEGCAATLSTEVWEDVKRRAAKGPSTSIEALIAAFE